MSDLHKIAKTTPSVSDFLRETYLEAQEHQRVVLRELAQRLRVSAPAVSRMAQRLVRKGYVLREGACGLALTDSGTRVAMKSLRKLRVFEVYLVKELGYGWDEVYGVASSACHHLDDDLIERMFAKLNKPARCPHGDPIPSRDGKIVYPATVRMTEVQQDKNCVISHVGTHDGEMLRYLTTLGMVPGAPITLVGRAPFSGPLRVRIKNAETKSKFDNEQVIGTELADVIWVEYA